MSNLICKLAGVRGRFLEVYDNKAIIRTEMTAGSILTSNATDGEKTIFYIDITGIQFKESRLAIGYLQLETPSMQMNNQGSNFFSENTFTFEEGKNGLTNRLMREIYRFISDRVEGYKYGTNTQPVTEPTEMMAALLPQNPVNHYEALPSSAPWTCAECGLQNRANAQYCQGCGCSKQWSLVHAKK